MPKSNADTPNRYVQFGDFIFRKSRNLWEALTSEPNASDVQGSTAPHDRKGWRRPKAQISNSQRSCDTRTTSVKPRRIGHDERIRRNGKLNRLGQSKRFEFRTLYSERSLARFFVFARFCLKAHPMLPFKFLRGQLVRARDVGKRALVLTNIGEKEPRFGRRVEGIGMEPGLRVRHAALAVESLNIHERGRRTAADVCNKVSPIG